MGKHRTGCIYMEMHNHGRRSAGSQDGNRSSCCFVKGVGMQRRYGYRWVAEIMYKKKAEQMLQYRHRVI